LNLGFTDMGLFYRVLALRVKIELSLSLSPKLG